MIIVSRHESVVLFIRIISPANLLLRPSFTAICRAKEKGIRADRKTVFRVAEPDVKEGALLFRCKVNTLPVLASVSSPENNGIMTYGPAQVLVVEEDGGQGGLILIGEFGVTKLPQSESAIGEEGTPRP